MGCIARPGSSERSRAATSRLKGRAGPEFAAAVLGESLDGNPRVNARRSTLIVSLVVSPTGS